MQTYGENSRYLLVKTDVLPEVFVRVVDAKQLLSSGKAASAAEAARQAGISRSAFYKYKDAVFYYEAQKTGRILTIHAMLKDRPGILSKMLSAFADAGANILTVNQNIPAGGAALVSIAARIDRLKMTIDEFIRILTKIDGVERVERIADDDF